MDAVRLPPWNPPRQFMRVQWVSQPVKDIWAPRIFKIARALEVLELESVYQGLRHSALKPAETPESLVQLNQQALAKGAVAFPLSLEGVSNAAYSASSTAYVPGKPMRFRTIVTKDPAPWVAHQQNDELTIGKLLGYPVCCAEFYQQIWVKEAWRDTTYLMSRGGTEGSPFGNILLRWLSVRLVRHLPCSFNCPESERIGRETYDLGKAMGFTQEMEWAEQLLSMDVEWSSLHGIAEVRLPLLRLSTSTDPFAARVVVQKKGTYVPEEAATGLHFPFVQLAKRKVTDSKSFQHSLNHHEWTDNGFNSKKNMDQAHDVLLRCLAGIELQPGDDVLDLGCGNGLLLEKVVNKYIGVTPHGVELKSEVAKRAYDRLPQGYIFPGNIKSLELWDEDYELIIFMPGRLREMAQEDADKVMGQLCKAKMLLLYTYSDNQHVSLEIIGSGHATHVKEEVDGVRAQLLVRAGVLQ